MRPNFLYEVQGDPLTRVARGTAAHPARSRLRHRGPASDQAAHISTAGDRKREEDRTRPHGEHQADGQATAGSWSVRSPAVRSVGSMGFTHLPESGPASGKTRGPLVQIPGRGKPARVAGQRTAP
jgi:hypothetical protein